MAGLKLTKEAVDRLPFPAKGQSLHWDSEIKGFGVLASAGGTKSWIIQYRTVGRQSRRMVIGRCNRLTADQARKQARQLLADVDLGKDPARDRSSIRSGATVQQLYDEWLAAEGVKSRPGTLKNRKSLWGKYIKPEFATKKVVEITTKEVRAFHKSIERPIAANRAYEFLRVLFSFAVAQEYRTDNPARGIEKNTETQRRRYLDVEQLERLNAAIDASPAQDSADVVRLLLLTGARIGEVFAMRWDQLDLKNRVWTKPAATTKQNREHRIPFSEPVAEILERRRHGRKSDWVFPARNSPTGHMTTIRSFWTSVCRKAEIEDFHRHDVRHTYASFLISRGQSLSVVGGMLGHSDQKTTSRYAHLLDDPLRQAASAVADLTTRKSSGAAKQAG